MTNYYTGIGSRETPNDILDRMTRLGSWFSELDWVLRSGGAEGADRAFERGVRVGKQCDIYIPWRGFAKHSDNPMVGSEFDTWEEAEEIAKSIHPLGSIFNDDGTPKWDNMKRGAKALHARNVYQVLGSDLKTPSKFVVYYAKETKTGEVSGGTRTAVMLARQHNIPCVNMLHDDWFDQLQKVWKEVNKK